MLVTCSPEMHESPPLSETSLLFYVDTVCGQHTVLNFLEPTLMLNVMACHEWTSRSETGPRSEPCPDLTATACAAPALWHSREPRNVLGFLIRVHTPRG